MSDITSTSSTGISNLSFLQLYTIYCKVFGRQKYRISRSVRKTLHSIPLYFTYYHKMLIISWGRCVVFSCCFFGGGGGGGGGGDRRKMGKDSSPDFFYSHIIMSLLLICRRGAFFYHGKHGTWKHGTWKHGTWKHGTRKYGTRKYGTGKHNFWTRPRGQWFEFGCHGCGGDHCPGHCGGGSADCGGAPTGSLEEDVREEGDTGHGFVVKHCGSLHIPLSL